MVDNSQIQEYMRVFLQHGPLNHEYKIQYFSRNVKTCLFAFPNGNSLVPVDDDGYILCNIGTFRHIWECGMKDLFNDELDDFSFIKNKKNVVEEKPFDFLKELRDL